MHKLELLAEMRAPVASGSHSEDEPADMTPMRRRVVEAAAAAQVRAYMSVVCNRVCGLFLHFFWQVSHHLLQARR